MFSHDTNGTGQTSSYDDFYDASAELADLGQARYDNDTAAAGDRDTALNSYRPVFVQEGRAPKGLEAEAFGWRTFQHTTQERDDREDLKSDLHEGQLHRQNRVARDMEEMQARMGHMGLHLGMVDMGMGLGGGGRGGRSGYGPVPMPMRGTGGSRGDRGGGRGGRGGRVRRAGGSQNGFHTDEGLCAGRKSDGPPLAKGFPEELDKSFFWDGPIE